MEIHEDQVPILANQLGQHGGPFSPLSCANTVDFDPITFALHSDLSDFVTIIWILASKEWIKIQADNLARLCSGCGVLSQCLEQFRANTRNPSS